MMSDKPRRSLGDRWKLLFCREPRRIAFVGSQLIAGGILAQVCVLLFAASPAAGKWLRFAFMLVSALGSYLLLWANVINSLPLALIGSPFLALGLTLLPIAQAIAPAASATQTSSIAAGAIFVVAVALIVVAVVCLMISTRELVRRPVLGSQNYLLFGSGLFGAGAIIFLLAVLPLLGVAQNYIPIASVSNFGYGIFLIGATIIWLNFGLAFTNGEFMILHRFPSTAVLKDSPTAAAVHYVSAILIVTGSFISWTALLFSSSWQAASSGFAVVAFARLLSAATHSVVHDYRYISASVITAAGFILAAVYISVPNSGDLGVASAVMIVMGALIALWRHWVLSRKTTSRSILETGNYIAFAEGLNLIGAVLFLIFSAIRYAGPTPSFNLLVLWQLLTLMGSTFLLFHASNSADIAAALHFSDDKFSSDQSVPRELMSESVPSEWGVDTVSIETDILIAGGGPAGLTLANELGLRNVRCLVLDKKETVVPDSRFFVINTATCEGLARLGVLDKTLVRGQQTSFGWGATFSSGMSHSDTVIFCSQTAACRNDAQRWGQDGSKLDASRSVTSVYGAEQCQRCMQSVQEAALVERLAEHGSATLEFGVTVLDFRIQSLNEGVLVLFQGRDGQRHVCKARFLVGCDGPSSLVSAKLQTRFDGFSQLHSSRSIYMHSEKLLEAVTHNGFPDSHQYHVVRREFGIGYFALRNAKLGLWTFHLHGIYNKDVSPASLKVEELRDVIREFIGPEIDFEIISDGRWRWSFAVARTFSKGPVFLAGDSCHQWPPFAAFGGNTAYGDVNNLGWKLALVVKGKAGRSLLDSYHEERRDQTLRLAMHISTMTPDPGRLKLLGKMVWNPLLKLIALARWHYGNSGEHSGNHYSSGGLQLGQRYDFSPIVIGGNEVSSPPEDPICSYIPKVVVGGRLLHVRFADGAKLNENVAMDAYTILQVSLRTRVEGVVDNLMRAFEQSGSPVSCANVAQRLRDGLHAGKRNHHCASLYLPFDVLIVRPDLYVAWTLHVTDTWTAEQAPDIVATLCGWSGETKVSSQSQSMTRWLTWRMTEQLYPMRVVFKKGVFVRNEEKTHEETKMTVRTHDGQDYPEMQQHRGETRVVGIEMQPVGQRLPFWEQAAEEDFRYLSAAEYADDDSFDAFIHHVASK